MNDTNELASAVLRPPPAKVLMMKTQPRTMTPILNDIVDSAPSMTSMYIASIVILTSQQPSNNPALELLSSSKKSFQLSHPVNHHLTSYPSAPLPQVHQSIQVSQAQTAQH